MEITTDIKYIGVNDHLTDLFEGQYAIPDGISYNSYIIIDEKIAVMDSVDEHFTQQWLENIEKELNDRQPDYLIVHHMECDHSCSIEAFMNKYDKTIIVSSKKAFEMMDNYFETQYEDRRLIVKEADTLNLGKHTLSFISAPMVHWPEVIMSFDHYEKALFSADAFGKFGALDVKQDWLDEARRYYIGIVGKYGQQVQAVLKKASNLPIAMILPLHGPVLYKNLKYYLDLYNTWSDYKTEKQGIMIAYTSVYGHTKKAIEYLEEQIKKLNIDVVVYDLARCDIYQAVGDAFAYGKLILATTTYNADIFPFMKEFINHLLERNIQNKTIALIENGSWAPQAAKIMKNMLEKQNNITFLDPVTIISAMHDKQKQELTQLANDIVKNEVINISEKQNENTKRYVCKICGYVYEGDELPEDFICPLCKHPAQDFEIEE